MVQRKKSRTLNSHCHCNKKSRKLNSHCNKKSRKYKGGKKKSKKNSRKKSKNNSRRKSKKRNSKKRNNFSSLRRLTDSYNLHNVNYLPRVAYYPLGNQLIRESNNNFLTNKLYNYYNKTPQLRALGAKLYPQYLGF